MHYSYMVIVIWLSIIPLALDRAHPPARHYPARQRRRNSCRPSSTGASACARPWQIVTHRPDGSLARGRLPSLRLAKAPGALIDIAVRAARPIGQGFYDVDVKETDRGFIIMEVNDNPNLEHGIEDQAGKDEIWIRVLKWFIERFEQ